MIHDQSAEVSLCSLRVGDQMFGIDTEQVQEVLGECVAHRVPLAPDYVAGVIPYRGEVLLTLSFRALLRLEPLGKPESVLVLQDADSGEIFGLAVDSVNDVLRLRADDLEENPCTLDERRKALFAGAYKLRDSVVVRLEPDRLRPTRLMQMTGRELDGLEREKVHGRELCAY